MMKFFILLFFAYSHYGHSQPPVSIPICLQLLATQEELRMKVRNEKSSLFTSYDNYSKLIKTLINGWEEDFYRLMNILSSTQINKAEYKQVLSKMKDTVKQVERAYKDKTKIIKKHRKFTRKLKKLKNNEIKVQENLRENNCND